MADKISFGAKGVGLFPITGTDSKTGLPTYQGTPVLWAGTKEFSFESKSESEVIYADDVAYFTLPGNASGETKLKTLTIPLAVQLAVLGVKLDSKKARIQGADLNKPTGLVVESVTVDDAGVQDAELFIFFNVTFDQPKVEMKTREDKTEPREYELGAKVASIVIPKVANPVYYVTLRKSEVTPTVYEAAKTTMYIPTVV